MSDELMIDPSAMEELRSIAEILPTQIWYRGSLDLLSLPLAAVIGSRDVSSLGAKRTKALVRHLARRGVGIVSGLAEGVDTIAHRSALDVRGATIAVMGTPIDKCYPRKNAALKTEIEERGLVMSQFPLGAPTRPGNFPRRNYVMAAISRVSIVVEAGENSGARHQVLKAMELGRPVAMFEDLADSDYPWIAALRRSPFLRVLADLTTVDKLAEEIGASIVTDVSGDKGTEVQQEFPFV